MSLPVLLALVGSPIPELHASDLAPGRDELRSEKSWFRQHFLKPELRPVVPASPGSGAEAPLPGLDVYANNGPVIQNGRGDKPLKIGDKQYTRGLYCHAVSQVEVVLPRPGKAFNAVVGLDHNEDTARGKGSVIFSVKVGDKVAFESGVMRYGTPAQEVNVDLAGSNRFTLEIGDAGDGIGWDQSDWADARATLADGTRLWLGEMPLRDRRTEVGPLPIQRFSNLPFSFVYGGKLSDELLSVWPRTQTTRNLDANRSQRELTWTDSQTGLQVRCISVEYKDFPVAEWTVFFKNTGPANTPILENIQALDISLRHPSSGEFTLHGNKGDWCSAQSYEPYELRLAPSSLTRFAPDGGRPTNGPKGWPYFNLESPEGGFVFAIGWPGQWACAFIRDAEQGLRIVAGQELTHLCLKPGEEIRTPLIAALFWKGEDRLRAQNLWRRWMLAHNVPRLNGKLPPCMLQMQCYRTFEKGGEADLFETVNEFNRASIPFDLCWRDAGWYPCKGSWPNTGTWELDPTRYPGGFRPFSDWIHQQGKKFIVWFEPERVGDRESWLAKNHPDWLLGGTLLNLGHREARNWLIEHIDRTLRDQGIDYYRQDFNLDPLPHWRAADAPDRRGITENKHVTGYLAFWDELRRRHPGLLIDSCASGGRRNDLETLRRAVPLLRSDFQFGHEATTPNQGHTYGISSWIPYYGSGCYFTDTYSARSYIMPCSGYAGTNAETKRAYEECRRAAPFMLGDFFPLTPYSLSPRDWIAWQFDCPEKGGGLIQAFRREQNEAATRVLFLKNLEASAKYELVNFDLGTPQIHTGKILMRDGLQVAIDKKPGAVVILYRKRR